MSGLRDNVQVEYYNILTSSFNPNPNINQPPATTTLITPTHKNITLSIYRG